MDVVIGKQFLQHFAVFIGPGHGQQRNVGAQAGQVQRHITGAAYTIFFLSSATTGTGASGEILSTCPHQ